MKNNFKGKGNSWITGRKLNNKLYEPKVGKSDPYQELIDRDTDDLHTFMSKQDERKVKVIITKVLTKSLESIIKENPKESNNIHLLKGRTNNSGEFGLKYDEWYKQYEDHVIKTIEKIVPKQFTCVQLHDGGGNFKIVFVDKTNRIAKYHIDFDHEDGLFCLTTMHMEEKSYDEREDNRNLTKNWIRLGTIFAFVGIGSVTLIGAAIIVALGFGYTDKIINWIHSESYDFIDNDMLFESLF